jgi:hypothetical protein
MDELQASAGAPSAATSGDALTRADVHAFGGKPSVV